MSGFINEFDIPKKNIPDCKSSLSCEINIIINIIIIIIIITTMITMNFEKFRLKQTNKKLPFYQAPKT